GFLGPRCRGLEQVKNSGGLSGGQAVEELLGHDAMVVLHVDNKVIAGEAIDLGEGWGEGDEVVMAVVVWLEKVVDLTGEKVAVRFRRLWTDLSMWDVARCALCRGPNPSAPHQLNPSVITLSSFDQMETGAHECVSW
ncbi:hypothetical protein GBA52_018822, partial [Prunus armeniaca]